MNTLIKTKNGQVYNLEDLKIRTIDFNVESPSYTYESNKIEGVNGEIVSGSSLNPRSITLSLYLESDSTEDYASKRDEVFNIFKSKDYFFAIDDRSPGKKWKARVKDGYKVDQVGKYGLFEVELIVFWGLSEATDQYKTNFTTNQFTVFNDGTETIDPREHKLVITFKGKSNKLRIKNNDTGEEWQYLKTTKASDTVKLDGVYPYKNSDNVFGDTNHGLITLIPGANDIRVYGAEGSYKVGFEFRPLYV